MFTLKLDEIPEEGLDLTWEEEIGLLVSLSEGLSRIDFDFEEPLQRKQRC